jgi:DNA topoisomerase-1
VLGQDENGVDVSLRTGRFGPYVQLGNEAKPPRASIPKGFNPDEVELDYALKLLSLPRDVGAHPEDGEMITAGLGRFGPFVKHKSTYANLSSVEEVFSVGLNRAVSLIAEKAASRGGAGNSVLKELGDHPDGGAITVKSGRYGPYVNHGKINATLPKEMEPTTVTLEVALELIAAKGGSTKKKAPAKKAAAKKPAAKKTATKKAPAKKPAAKKASPKAES